MEAVEIVTDIVRDRPDCDKMFAAAMKPIEPSRAAEMFELAGACGVAPEAVLSTTDASKFSTPGLTNPLLVALLSASGSVEAASAVQGLVAARTSGRELHRR